MHLQLYEIFMIHKCYAKKNVALLSEISAHYFSHLSHTALCESAEI